MRRLPALLLVAVLVVAAATLGGAQGAGAAHTRSGYITEPLLDPVYAAEVTHYLDPGVPIPPATTVVNPVTSTAITSGDVLVGEGAAELASGVVGSVPPFALVVGGAVAAYAGWKIGTADYKAIHDLFSAPSPGASGVLAVQWACETGTVSPTMAIPAGATCGSSTSSTGFSLGASSTSVDGGHGGYVLLLDGTGSFCYVIASGVGCNSRSTYALQFVGAGNRVNYTAGASSCGNTAGTQGCFWIWRSPQQMVANTVMTDSNSTAYAASPAAAFDGSGYTVPAIAPSSSGYTAAIGALGGYSPIGSTSAGQAAARCSLDVALDPSYACSTATGSPAGTSSGATSGTTAPSFVIPDPQADDTFDSYSATLRGLGYLGTINRADDAMPYAHASYAAKLNPDSLTRIKVGTATEDDLYDLTTGAQVAWSTHPVSQLTVTPSTTTSITLTAVPHTYDPVATGGASSSSDTTGSGGGAGGGGLDFGPLAGLSFGCKFPFGFFCYAQDVTGWFDTTPTAPDFTITVPSFSTPVGTVGPFAWGPIDLSYLDTYMSWMRDLILLAVTVGVVYRVAARLLGFGADGDPGEAADEALFL